MGRWWTGYTSISAGRLSIAHSHGEPWLFAATEGLQPAYGYGLWKAKRPSEKMGSIAVCGGAGCGYGLWHSIGCAVSGAGLPWSLQRKRRRSVCVLCRQRTAKGALLV